MNNEAIQQQRQRHIEGGKRKQPFLPMVFIQRRLLLILPLGALAALMLVLVMPRSTTTATFEAAAMILIDPRKEPTVGGRDRDVIPGTFREYSLTLVTRMASIDIMRATLERLSPEEHPAFLDPARDVEYNARRLLARFEASELRRTQLFTASLSAPDPGNLGVTLNTIVEVFIDHLQTEQEGLYARRLQYLTDERHRLEERISGLRNQLLAMAAGIESSGFLHENYTLHLNRIDVIDRLYWSAQSAALEKQGLLDKALADRETIAALDQRPLADERVMTSWALNNIEHWTYTQLQAMRSTIDGLTRENEDRQYVEERMEAMDRYRTEIKDRIITDTISNMDAIRLYHLDAEVVRARSAYEAAQQTVTGLAADLLAAQQEAEQISAEIFRGKDIAFTITQLRERLATLNIRIDDAEIEAKAPVRISLEQRATDPVRPVRTANQKVLLMAVALGFGAVFAFVLGVDFLDNRIRAPRELELALGAPGPDPVTAFSSSISPAPVFERASIEVPDHPALDALRGLAVRMNMERERHHGRIFAVLGINDDCGATSVATNLAHVLTAFGKRVLLVETNMRRPGLRAALDLPPGNGLDTVLQGTQECADLVQRDPTRGIDVLFAEGRTDAPPLQRLIPAIDELAESYDFVLVDGGNVTADATAYHVGAHADAAILIARADVSLYRDLRQAIDALVQAGVPALTAILTFANPLFMTRFLDRLQQPLTGLTRIHKWVRRRLPRIPLPRKGPTRP
jgi:polysaccharide biosynthesis transport protein